ncbi:hypothetical protein ACFFX0_20280 [Citricoccus parietis]|uniref:Uncharacterized protein n=1 Tax=Citricoccus parietis TaxID=592307 RepID=A0ABV5G4K8_9MICC
MRLGRSVQGRQGLLTGGVAHGAQGLFGGRIEDVERLAGGAVNPSASDEELLGDLIQKLQLQAGGEGGHGWLLG